MSHSLSDPIGSFFAPIQKEGQPVVTLVEGSGSLKNACGYQGRCPLGEQKGGEHS
jgi:hypothetical protein